MKWDVTWIKHTLMYNAVLTHLPEPMQALMYFLMVITGVWVMWQVLKDIR